MKRRLRTALSSPSTSVPAARPRRPHVPGRRGLLVVRGEGSQPIIVTGDVDSDRSGCTPPTVVALPWPMDASEAADLCAGLGLAVLAVNPQLALVVRNRLDAAIEAAQNGRPVPSGLGRTSGWFDAKTVAGMR